MYCDTQSSNIQAGHIEELVYMYMLSCVTIPLQLREGIVTL